MSFKLIRITKHKAKKIYRCIWCNENILVCEIYVCEISTYCDEFQDHKFHIGCDIACINYCNNNNGEFTPYDNKKATIKVSQ